MGSPPGSGTAPDARPPSIPPAQVRTRDCSGTRHASSLPAAAFLTQTIALPTETVKFEIWDTAGQERYRSLAPMYYRGAQAAVVVFSLVDAESFNGAKAWVSELQKHGGSDMIIALAGNKNDLGHVRKVDRDTALEYARANGCFYLETSAKTAAGVQDLFTEVAKRVPKTSAPPRNAEFLDSSEPPSGKCC